VVENGVKGGRPAQTCEPDAGPGLAAYAKNLENLLLMITEGGRGWTSTRRRHLAAALITEGGEIANEPCAGRDDR